MVDQIRKQAHIQSYNEVTAHVANAVANSLDAANAHDRVVINFGRAAPEIRVDVEYDQTLVSA